MTIRVDVLNAAQITSQLHSIDQKLTKTTIRKATNAAGKVVLNTTKREAQSIRVTGFTGRSLKSVSKSKSGTTTVRVGQAKQKTFKARKSPRVKGRNLSQIQRAGKPVPIHWIERGTKSHTISAAGKGNKRTYSDGSNVLVFRVGRKLIFAKTVRVPGSRPRRLLERSARISKSASAQAFTTVVKQDL